jgi:hypothetical protein
VLRVGLYVRCREYVTARRAVGGADINQLILAACSMCSPQLLTASTAAAADMQQLHTPVATAALHSLVLLAEACGCVHPALLRNSSSSNSSSRAGSPSYTDKNLATSEARPISSQLQEEAVEGEALSLRAKGSSAPARSSAATRPSSIVRRQSSGSAAANSSGSGAGRHTTPPQSLTPKGGRTGAAANTANSTGTNVMLTVNKPTIAAAISIGSVAHLA